MIGPGRLVLRQQGAVPLDTGSFALVKLNLNGVYHFCKRLLQRENGTLPMRSPHDPARINYTLPRKVHTHTPVYLSDSGGTSGLQGNESCYNSEFEH